MAELLLDSLEIKGYRCFEHLTIEKLGRVNLIVGKNNVGKTALLEALWIYANNSENHILNKIVFDRNEVNNSDSVSHEGMRYYSFAYRNVFNNRPEVPKDKDHVASNPYFCIGEIGQNFVSFDDTPKLVSAIDIENQIKSIVFSRYDYEPSLGMPFIKTFRAKKKELNNVYVDSSGLEGEKLLPFWEKAEKELLDEFVNESLNIIEDKFVDVRFSGDSNNPHIRIPMVRLKNAKERIPLRSLGEGMERMLGIALALVNCKDGILLIDEIENGFHYSILPDVWRLIFKTAKDLNVQVFATTHSKDCIEAFTQAAIDDEESEGILIRLERRGEKIIAKTINEERLSLAVNHDVEVR